jgi:hypothetical protein
LLSPPLATQLIEQASGLDLDFGMSRNMKKDPLAATLAEGSSHLGHAASLQNAAKLNRRPLSGQHGCYRPGKDVYAIRQHGWHGGA